MEKVCKTLIRAFESHSHLHLSPQNPTFSACSEISDLRIVTVDYRSFPEPTGKKPGISLAQFVRLMRRRYWHGEGFVYFMADEAGHVKIGWSGKPERRRKEIQKNPDLQLSENAGSISLLGTIGGMGIHAERFLHNHFENDRIVREWFRPGPELASLIQESALNCSRDCSIGGGL